MWPSPSGSPRCRLQCGAPAFRTTAKSGPVASLYEVPSDVPLEHRPSCGYHPKITVCVASVYKLRDDPAVFSLLVGGLRVTLFRMTDFNRQHTPLIVPREDTLPPPPLPSISNITGPIFPQPFLLRFTCFGPVSLALYLAVYVFPYVEPFLRCPTCLQLQPQRSFFPFNFDTTSTFVGVVFRSLFYFPRRLCTTGTILRSHIAHRDLAPFGFTFYVPPLFWERR